MESRPPDWGEKLFGTFTLCAVAGFALFLSPGLVFDWEFDRFKNSPKGLFGAAVQDGQTWLCSFLFWAVVGTAVAFLCFRSRARLQPEHVPSAATPPYEDWQQTPSSGFAETAQEVNGTQDDEWEVLRTDEGCAEMLGISGDITMKQIRTAYRQKIAEYHPDKVAALGPKLRDLAEVESKRLNVAYQYFEEKYGGATSAREAF